MWLQPKPAATPLAAFTSADADTAADILLEHGFCVLPDLISADDLQRMRGAFEAATADGGFGEEAQWAAGTERKDLGKYFSFDMFSEKSDPAFYALADPPLLMNVIHRALGRPAPFQVCNFPRVSSFFVSVWLSFARLFARQGSGGRVLPVVDEEVQ